MALRHARGRKATMPQLLEGQFAVTKDTEEVFAGINQKNIRVLDEKDRIALEEAIESVEVDTSGLATKPELDNLTIQLEGAVKEVNGVKPTDGKITLPIPQVDTSNLRTKTEKLKLEDMSPEALAAIEGGEGTSFNLLSIPQNDSVDESKLSTGLKDSLLIMLKNMVANGDFSNGLTGWTKKGTSTFTSVDIDGQKWGRFTDFANIPNLNRTETVPMKAGDVWYLGMSAKSDFNRTTGDNALGGFIHASVPNSPPLVTPRYNKANRNTVQRLSGLFTVPTDGNYFIGIQMQMINEGTYAEVTGVTAINLTETFGKGKEPPLNEIEGILSKYRFGWFEGSKSISNIKGIQNDLIAAKTEMSSLSGKFNDLTSEKNIITTVNNPRSDITFVGDELWAFRASDYGGTALGGAIYIHDSTTNQMKRRLIHDFGHVNTIDYKKETDSLIFGNGSGYYDTDGSIHIIQGGITSWRQLAEDTKLSLAGISGSHIATINVGRDFGDKLNVCWGEDNNGKHNICYVLSNDNQNVARLLLGQGSNNLGNGQFIADLTGNLFNGTYKILKQWTTPNLDVNQGTCYYNGFVYSAIGHDCLWAIKMALNNDGTISITEKHEISYDDQGNRLEYASEGIAIRNGVVYHGVMGALNAIVKYPVF